MEGGEGWRVTKSGGATLNSECSLFTCLLRTCCLVSLSAVHTGTRLALSYARA